MSVVILSDKRVTKNVDVLSKILSDSNEKKLTCFESAGYKFQHSINK